MWAQHLRLIIKMSTALDTTPNPILFSMISVINNALISMFFFVIYVFDSAVSVKLSC